MKNLEVSQVRTKEILEIRKIIGPRKRETYRVYAIGLSNRSRGRNNAKVLPNL